ncbi:protein of unknown function [Candidatus Methylomirabilis oxygeniifera]|uniref:Uncharacterized protein n=1 Tax=Methylomirabilis oxygeniifera TaxID=671143 RepID=D5MGY9_METO1|nr:protein of unknown function [Candidatus Methylomirabilis oxyfera]
MLADFDTGALSNHHLASALSYFSVIHLRDHAVAHGDSTHQPLP